MIKIELVEESVFIKIKFIEKININIHVMKF